MADLHIGSKEKTEPIEDEFIKKSVELIKEKVPKDSVIMLCLCGDIIDSKNIESEDKETRKRYKKAAVLIKQYVHLLEDFYKVSVGCCPGNHDITHGDDFFEFVQDVGGTCISKKQMQSCYVHNIEGLHLLFVNSCVENQYEFGRIDYEALERELSSLPREEGKILVLHHTIMSMYDDDSSSIRNAAKLINIIDKYNIAAILHGHIHGREILKLGEKRCKVIGTGALFSRNNTNINSQFNIIHYNYDRITEIFNCRYNADGGNIPWNICDLMENSYEYVFEGKSFEDVYKQLLNMLNSLTPLYNVVLRINTEYSEFCESLEKFLKEDYMKIGEKKYNYFDLAEKWEADEVPDDLYFNHGSYFKVNGTSGIDFVKEQLSKKPTSSRIVLATYRMKDIIESLDDSIYLPSLESIQFGRSKNSGELLVHMQLRALEASRFLKINICEIAYILKKLREGNIVFDKVEITISAFRVQKKERFNCFLKAEIDKLTAQKLGAKVNHGKIDELCKLLEEKRDGMETITKVNGIQNVFEAMKASNEEADENAPIRYADEILEMFKEVLDIYKRLDSIHRESSIHSEEEEQCEKNIDELLGKLVQKLKVLNKK